ncbi:MAG: redoxin domain-containing protein [Candidatus Bipolaricaulaceae bacterium]
MRQLLILAFALLSVGVAGQEVQLSPTAPATLGDWAQVALPFRLHPTLDRDVSFRGQRPAMTLWGDLVLGEVNYAVLLGVGGDGTPRLWIDRDLDGVILAEEALPPSRPSGYFLWSVELPARPAPGQDYPYPLQVLWPEGRGYVFLQGGAPRSGTASLNGREHALAVVDGDIDGVFGSRGDYFAVDVDGDGELHGEPGGHERFSIREVFTVADSSFRIAELAPDGRRAELAPAPYVPPKPPLIPGHPAPQFSFRPLRGEEPIALSYLVGKVVLLDFWATWCGPCMEELPNVIELYNRYHDQGFEVVGISLDTDESALRAVLTQESIPWPQCFDGQGWDSAVAQLYRVYGIPATFLLDRQGIINARDLRGEELAERVAQLLAESAADQAPPTEVTPPAMARPEPILELSVPDRVGILPAGETEIPLRVENTSPHLAEEVTVVPGELPAGISAQRPDPLELAGFASRTVTVPLRAEELAPGEHPVALAITYHYCIGESCFQMSQQLRLTLAVGEPPTPPARPAQPWWLLVALGVGLALAWLLLDKGGSALVIVLVLAAGAAVGVGLQLGQARQAQLVGAVICTSCVGIETAPPAEPHLSPATVAALKGLTEQVHLVVFHAPWCHSCPYAIALAQAFAEVNPLVEVELVDAEQDPERAQAAGVFRSGRLVVPAVLESGSGRAVFGTTDLEARLRQLVVGD